MSCLSNWENRRKITIDHTKIDSDLTHFPVPIPIGTSVGMSAQDVSSIFDELGSESLKIAVTKADAETQIYAEVEQWDEINEKALLWVSESDLTLSSSGTTELYIYYDSSQSDNTTYVGDTGDSPAQDVWDSNFVGVWHMAQDPTGGAGCILDSTSNGNHATPNGTFVSGDLEDAPLGKCLDFDGNSWLSVSDDPSMESTHIEVMCRMYRRDAGVSYPTPIAKGTSDRRLWIYESGDEIRWRLSVYDELTSSTIGVDQWYSFAAYYDGSTTGLWMDGAEDTSSSASGDLSDTSYDWSIGARTADGEHPIDGKIAEVRIMLQATSDAWRKADYHAQTDNLLTWGAEEDYTIPELSITKNIYIDDLNNYQTESIDLTSVNGTFNMIKFNITDSSYENTIYLDNIYLIN